MTALAHPVGWRAPRPLWRGTGTSRTAPQILRFASDDFMDQLLSILADEPARISDRIARPETWRDPPQPADRTDPIVRVPLPAPLREAKRLRRRTALPTTPPSADPQKPLKLYQPAHQRYYVVAGTLACTLPGLPERALAGGHESVHFVLRRLLPRSASPGGDQSAAEFAFVKQGDEARWQICDSGTALAPGEELLPLFPLAHRDETGAHRTLWSGLIPVGRREDYLGKEVSRDPVALVAGQEAVLRDTPPAAARASKMARTTQLRMEVIEPWKAMVRAATKAAADIGAPPPDGSDIPTETSASRARNLFRYNIQFQMQSWLLLLDLRQWIADYLPLLDTAIQQNAAPAAGTRELEIWTWLGTAGAASLEVPIRNPDPPGNTANLKPLAASLRDALRSVAAAKSAIPAFAALVESKRTQYTAATAIAGEAGWPAFHFPLAGLRVSGSGVVADGPFAQAGGIGLVAADVSQALDPEGTTTEEATTIVSPIDAPTDVAADLDKVAALFARALVADAEATAPPIPHAMKVRDVLIKTANDPGRFVIRMVHLNADCGPLHPPTFSGPSDEFRLASFFDPEAPVRPITITLPLDTSPAGLRKHGRGAAFVMSDLLCGQVQRAKGLGFVDLVRQVLPWPFHKDIDVGDGGGCKGGSGLEIGMICSLSIPIITLCALILLIIIVTLLDFIFRWLPWFIACFPVPKLKGKSP